MPTIFSAPAPGPSAGPTASPPAGKRHHRQVQPPGTQVHFFNAHLQLLAHHKTLPRALPDQGETVGFQVKPVVGKIVHPQQSFDHELLSNTNTP
jgi:hypothetical protein